MDPRLWLYLDNLRNHHPPSTNLIPEWLAWAEIEARAKGFVDDALRPNRLTRKGEIALRVDDGKEDEEHP